MKITSEGNFKVTGLEVIDVQRALSALNIARSMTVEPEELSDFETCSLRVAAARGKERSKLGLIVYDTESLTDGLPLIEEQERQELLKDDISRSERREHKATLRRVENLGKGLGRLAARNSK